ncbi:hypothetical protein ISW64_07155 [Escherichia coli]|uniref:hypothetical protein n=1 Tax=Escherichia coli TaxID=562 RepID=UPI0018890D59|nr:hypothetical protein [Escherichia coli]MBF1824660.1 hypothetical protein [Escherichia coli]
MKKILLALTLLFSSCAFAGSELELNKVNQRFQPVSAILTIDAHNVYYVKSYLSDAKCFSGVMTPTY